jgi:abortive infection bacteriophage resistance protein
MIYSKDVLSPLQLVAHLCEKGLLVEDYEEAATYIASVSYYRFKGFAWSFRFSRGHPDAGRFYPETRFDDIRHLMEMDRELRLLTLDGIERIELDFRTTINEHLCQQYNTPFWYHDESLFKRDKFKHKEFLAKCEREVQRSQELFTRHYLKKYASPHLPPGWILIEIETFGTWSRIFQNLATPTDRTAIANRYNVPVTVIESWAHSLNIVRNTCAHHARLWNREFRVTPKIPHAMAFPAFSSEKRFAPIAAVISYLLRAIGLGTSWTVRLSELLTNSGAKEKRMGFCDDWRSQPFWRL